MKIQLDKREVLRYLGHRGQELSPEMDKLVEGCMQRTLQVIQPRWVYRHFPLVQEKNAVRLGDSQVVMRGKDIVRHLQASKECVLMAVTIGSAIEKEIRMSEYTQLSRSLILDSCATTAVEAVCDAVEEEIRAAAAREGNAITWRYSPGYGDFGIDIQKEFLRLLEAEKKIGLCASSSSILIPRKSVTAVIGILPPGVHVGGKRGCEACANRERCVYRKNGGSCGSV